MADSFYYPFDIETVEKIMQAFETKNISSEKKGTEETIFVPISGLDAQKEEEAVAALMSLVDEYDEGMEEIAKKRDESYRATTPRSAEKLAQIANMMADLKARNEVEKAYTFRNTNKNILFVPREGVDTAVADQLLKERFNVLPTKINKNMQGLVATKEEHQKITEFMASVTPENIKSERYQERLHHISEQDIREIYELAQTASRYVELDHHSLRAKKGTTEEDIKKLQHMLRKYAKTTLQVDNGKAIGLKASMITDRNVVFYSAMLDISTLNKTGSIKPSKMAVEILGQFGIDEDGMMKMLANSPKKSIKDWLKRGVNAVKTAAGKTAGVVRDAAGDVWGGYEELEAEKSVVPPQNNGIKPENSKPINAPITSPKTPKEKAKDAAELKENETSELTMAYFAEMLQINESRKGKHNVVKSLRTAMQYAALSSAGVKIDDTIKFSDNIPGAQIEQIASGLKGSALKTYETQLNALQKSYLELLPPQTLANLIKSVNRALKKEDKETDAYKDLTARSVVLKNRADEIIKGVHSGELVIDGDNIANLFDGMTSLLDTQKDNALAPEVQKKLDRQIEQYDRDNGLSELSAINNERLANRFFQLTGVTGQHSFDITNLEGLMKGAKPADTDIPLMTMLQFHKEDGSVLTQTQKNADGKDSILAGGELDIYRQLLAATLLNSLTLSDEELNQETVNQALHDAININTHALITADLISKNQEPNPDLIAGIMKEMAEGKPYPIQQRVMTGFVASTVEAQKALINRLGSKIGKDASTVNALYRPIQSVNALAEKRFGADYRRATLMTRLFNSNVTRSVLAMATSKVAIGLGGPILGFGIAAGMTALRFRKIRREEVAEAKRLNKPIPSMGSFLKANSGGISLSIISMAAMGLSMGTLPLAISGFNLARSAWATIKAARKNDLGTWATIKKVTSSLIPTASTLALAAVTGDYLCNIGQSAMEDINGMMTETPAHLPTPDTPQVAQVNIENFEVQTMAVTHADGIPVQTLATDIPAVDASLPPIAEEVPEAPIAEEVPEAPIAEEVPEAPIAEEVPEAPIAEEVFEHHAYDKSDHDLAHARLYGEGVYDSTGQHPARLDYTHEQMGCALEQMHSITQNYADLTGPDGQSNDEILMNKLNNLVKLTSVDTDLNIDGQRIEAGEYFGVKDADGKLYTAHDLRADLLAGREVNPEMAAEILAKVEGSMSAKGHFLEDIRGFNEAKNDSYRPGGDPGWKPVEATPEPTPDVNVQTGTNTGSVQPAQPQTPAVDTPKNVQPAQPQTPAVDTPKTPTVTPARVDTPAAEPVRAEPNVQPAQPQTPAADTPKNVQPAQPQTPAVDTPKTPTVAPARVDTPAAEPVRAEPNVQPTEARATQPTVPQTETGTAPSNGGYPSMTEETLNNLLFFVRPDTLPREEQMSQTASNASVAEKLRGLGFKKPITQPAVKPGDKGR